ncbi:MAG: methyltransferase [Desulfobacterales bacterium]|jgi:trans-aconitate methyltransferase
MNADKFKVLYPDDDSELDQNEEFFTLVTDEGSKRLRIHDYDKVYTVPGLYEEVVYDHLKCDSPRTVCNLLAQQINAAKEPNDELKALDFGAGNGISGECLADKFDCEALIGLDIFPEAQEAARRDRPEIYDDYYVMDLSEPSDKDLQTLDKWNFNVLLTVAALGYGDIPTQGFINAFNLVETDGWVAFNIKDRFMSREDDTGYHDTLNTMMGNSLEVLKIHHYCHRLSMSGDPLHYYAVVGRKKDEINLSQCP